jgi:hypothetical protein
MAVPAAYLSREEFFDLRVTKGQGRLTLCIRERPRHLYAEGQGDLLGRQRAYSDLYHHGHGSSPRIGRTV